MTARGHLVTFAGPRRVESRLVTDAGYDFDDYRVDGFPREIGFRLLRSAALAVAAPVSCLAILRRRKPDCVLGGGGYAAGPMVASAGIRGIPAALSEADAHFGLANRLAAPFAGRVFLSFPIAGLDGPKFHVTGRPIPARSRVTDRAWARRTFGLPADGPVVLIFGGSQGASRLNQAALDSFASAGPAVLHLCGEREFSVLRNRVTRTDYALLPFTDEFGAALAAADLVVSRAGGSVWEVAAAGRPAILVPYPHATGDHQRKNAEHFADAGGALLVAEAELDLPSEVNEILGDPARLAEMGAAMHRLARPSAADDVAEELIALATS